MKKILIITLGILVIISSFFLTKTIVNYENYKSDIEKRQGDIEELEEKIKISKEEKENKEKEYKKIIKDREKEIEEYQKWEKKVEEIKDLL